MSKFDTILPSFGITATEYIKRNAYQTDEVLHEALAAQGVHVSIGHMRKHRTAMGIKKTGSINSKIIGDSPYQLYTHPLEYSGDACVLGDTEFPFHHAEFMNRVLEVCQRWNIRHVTFGGDAIHNDNLTSFDPPWAEEAAAEAVSPDAHDRLLKFRDSLPKGYQKKFDAEVLEKVGIQVESPHTGISKEWDEATKQFIALQQVFTSADWVLGNHEGRLLRTLQSPVVPRTMKDIFIKGSEWIRIAPYYYSVITSGGKSFRVTHPKNSSVRPASIALRLCETKDTNIIQCHNHLLGKAVSANGKYVAIETGCCVDGMRLPYYSQRDTTRPAWALGATIIRDGYAWLLDDINTDWAALMRM